MNEKAFNPKYLGTKILETNEDYFLWLGEDKQTHTPVIIKELNKKSPKQPLAGKEFTRECSLVQKLAALPSPHIVKIYFVDPQNTYYVMEHVPGFNLQDYIEAKKNISEEKAIEICIQLAYALSIIYAKYKIIHRNIEPKNILLHEQTLQPKLAGLGIIKAQDSMNLTIVNDVKGTFFYLAPELIYGDDDGERNYSIQSDMYGLGLTFFFLLRGTHLFDQPAMIINFVQQGKLPGKFKEIQNRNIARIIFQMLEREPQKRFYSYEELITALQELQKTLGYKVTELESCAPNEIVSAPEEKSYMEKTKEEIAILKKSLNELIKNLKDFKDATLNLEAINPKPTPGTTKEAQVKEKNFQEVNLLKKDVNSLIKVIRDLKERVMQMEAINNS